MSRTTMTATSPPKKNPARPHANTARLLCVVATAFIVSVALGCSQTRQPVSIEFFATYNGQAIDCQSQPVALTDLRFYVFDIRTNGDQPMPLLRDEQWQTRELALLDLEDASGTCINGSAVVNTRIRGTVQAGDHRGLSFTIGVPFAANHADPLQAEAPLDNGPMHWHWRSGYKFLRAGVAGNDSDFWLHLGSTGCKGRVGAIRECSAPNRVRVELPDFLIGDRIEIDLSAVLVHAQQSGDTARDCSSGPSEAACESPFVALGLGIDATARTNQQHVFRARP